MDREIQPRDNSSSLSTLGAAIGIGAGAAFMYKKSGWKVLSDTMMGKGSLLRKQFLKETGSIPLNKMSYDQFKGSQARMERIWNSPAARQINVDINRGMTGSEVEATSKISEKMDEILRGDRRQYIQERLLADTGIRDIDKSESLFSYAEKVLDNQKMNAEGIYVESPDLKNISGLLEGAGIPEAQRSNFFETVLQAARDYDLSGREELVRSSSKDIANLFERQIYDLEGMKKSHGFLSGAGAGKDRPATLGDVLQAREADPRAFASIKIAKHERDVIDGMMEKINRSIAEARMPAEQARREWMSIYFNPDVRISETGEVYSTSILKSKAKRAIDEFGITLPGKILKTAEFFTPKYAPKFEMFGAGTQSIMAAAIGNKTNRVPVGARSDYFDAFLQDPIIKIHTKIFRLNKSESADNINYNLEHLQNMDDKMYLISDRFGFHARLTREISGITDRVGGPKNKLLRKLDMFTSVRPHAFKEYSSIISKYKDPNYIKNVIGRLKSYDYEAMRAGWQDGSFIDRDIEAAALRAHQDVSILEKYMNQHSRPISKTEMSKLLSHMPAGTSKALAEAYLGGDKALVSAVANRVGREEDGLKLANSHLAGLVGRWRKNPEIERDYINIVTNRALFGETSAFKFNDAVRREVSKEILMTMDENTARRVFRDADLGMQAKKDMAFLYGWTQVQKTSRVGIGSPYSEAWNKIARVEGLFSPRNPEELNISSRFIGALDATIKDTEGLFSKGIAVQPLEVINTRTSNAWGMAQKMITPLDVLKNLNDKTIRQGFARQFTAGRGNMHEVTTATLLPFFSLSRLMEPLAELGLGFSSRSTSSVGSLAWNMGVKRIIPAIAMYTAWDYMDYRSEVYTGTSLTGAAANAAATMDIGARRILDKVGIGGILKGSGRTNVISRYIFGETGYQDAEERKQYYQGGYTPVRKGRWWSFGSSSEFRGGKIAYWEPNYLIRAHSNWRDVGIYGSQDEKWAHSWIPTPSHPFAPIRRLLDPYWLENKHYWDRPYPVTAPEFEETTPWGPLLNATIGELVKPRKRMHQAELGSSLIDVRDIIRKQNQQTMQGQGIVMLDNKSLRVARYNPEAVNALLGYDSQGIDQPSFISGAPTSMSVKQFETWLGKGGGSLKGSFGTAIAGSKVGGVISVAAGAGKATGYIQSMNETIKSQGLAPPGSVTFDRPLSYGPNWLPASNLEDEEISDLLTQGDTTSDLWYARYGATEILGIYGFLAESSIFKNERHKRLANAGNMSSFSRDFWDTSIGGLGGSFMEIARRFFPHDPHHIKDINPIRNLMPEWIPERFKHGDPYTIIPKGEMRLPGAGYEDIYSLHPDAFGKYGAYDRFKILADISPGSNEYKMWREISSKTIADPILRKQMKDIRHRVTVASKEHEFFPYRFAKMGGGLERQKAIIEELVGANSFKIVGDKKTIYKMAGVTMTKDIRLSEYLKPGMEVDIAYNPEDKRNVDAYKSTNAVVYTSAGNINREIFKTGLARERKTDYSEAGMEARFNEAQRGIGALTELIGHAPIPIIHNKFMRVETALESWKSHEVYGYSYTTWTNPIQGFIMPSLWQQWQKSPFQQAMAVGVYLGAEKILESNAHKSIKNIATITSMTMNPSVFIGKSIGFGMKLSNAKGYVRMGGRIGMAAGLIGYGASNIDDPVNNAINLVAAGELLNFKYGKEDKWLWDFIGRDLLKSEKITSHLKDPRMRIASMALTGLLVGDTMSGTTGRQGGKFIPEKTRKRWEINEYFDRLSYIKYRGLYEKYSRMAESEEDVNVPKLFRLTALAKRKSRELKEKMQEFKKNIQLNYSDADPNKKLLLKQANATITEQKIPKMIMSAGPYTRMAIAYKEASENTIFGLPKDALWAQILKAIPKKDRDYFMAFAQESNQDEKEKILKYTPKYMHKALETAWAKKEISSVRSNEEYFDNHNLPGTTWAGWRPDINLEDIKVKEIKNEGLLLSDFGYYESQTDNLSYKAAPLANMRNVSGGTLSNKVSLESSLRGYGIKDSNVEIKENDDGIIDMVVDLFRSNTYEFKQELYNKLGVPTY